MLVVASYIGSNLGSPVVLSGSWDVTVITCMPVPEAATDLDDRTVFGQDDIRLAWQASHVKSVAVAAAEENLAQRKLGPGIA